MHRAFAVRGDVADDERAAVILQGGGGDFRSGRAEAVDHHHERSVIKFRRVGIRIRLHPTIGIARHDNRAVLDEQAGELDGFLQRTAGIRAQINDDAGNFFRLQFVDEFNHVCGGAFGRGVAVAAKVHRGVKRWQVYDADALAVRQFDQLRLGLRIFEFDFVADEGDDLARGAVGNGADGQTHFGAFRPADLLDDFFQIHVHHIHRRLVALCDGHDAIFFEYLLALGRRPAGHQRTDGAIAVVLRQLCADAKKREVHADGKILCVRRAEIIRMRIVSVGEAVQISLQHSVAVPVRGHAEVPLVMPGERGGNILGRIHR